MYIYRNSDFSLEPFKINEPEDNIEAEAVLTELVNKDKIKGAFFNMLGNLLLSVSLFLVKYISNTYPYIPTVAINFYQVIPIIIISGYRLLSISSVSETVSKVTKHKKVLFFRCTNSFINFITLILASRYLRITTCSTIYSLSPIITSFMAVFFLNDKLTRVNVICLIVSLIGCLLLANPFKESKEGEDTLFGFFFAFIFIFSRGSTVILQKTLSNLISIELSIFIINFSNLIISFTFSLTFNYSLVLNGTPEFFLLMLNGIISFTFLFFLFTSLTYSNVVFLQMFYPSIILFGFILSTCFSNEKHVLFDFIGAGIVLIVNIYSSYFAYKSSIKR